MPKEIIATNHAPTGVPMWKNGERVVNSSPSWRLSVGWQADGHDVQVGAGIDGDLEAGQFFHLDRQDLNRLIRTLRKARDSAFGADA